MSKSRVQLPKNTPKSTGIGCFFVGSIFLITAFCIFLTGFMLNSVNQYIAIGAAFSAFGVIGLITGIGLFFKGKQVDKLLSGEDLLAQWNYFVDESGKRKNGYVYIGTKGFYKDGFHVSWSDKCVLQDVRFQTGTPAILTFQYLRISYNSSANGWSSKQNNFPIPVPPDKIPETQKVIEYYKNQLQNKDTHK